MPQRSTSRGPSHLTRRKTSGQLVATGNFAAKHAPKNFASDFRNVYNAQSVQEKHQQKIAKE